MDLVEIKDGLFIGSAINNTEDIAQIIGANVEVVIDLQGGFDQKELAYMVDSYLYCRLWDLWIFSSVNTLKVNRIASYGLGCWRDGQGVAVHCTQGKNRSALIVGIILFLSGMEGKDVVTLIQEKRPGSLYNPIYREYLEKLTRKE